MQQGRDNPLELYTSLELFTEIARRQEVALLAFRERRNKRKQNVLYFIGGKKAAKELAEYAISRLPDETEGLIHA